MKIAGKVKQLNLQAQGVGEVDARKLIAQDANVTFQGIGTVDIYASGKLDAQVNGMGELRYYGHPKTVNKSVSGIGSVKAGDEGVFNLATRAAANRTAASRILHQRRSSARAASLLPGSRAA